MRNDEIIEVGRPLPLITAVKPVGDRLVHILLTYPDDVVEKTVDLAPILWSKRIFIPLREDDALFATLRVNEDGTALEFGDGDIDISADWIERMPQATMEPREFIQIMDDLKATNEAMGRYLGVATRLVAKYKMEGAVIPRRVSLAARYVWAIHRSSDMVDLEERGRFVRDVLADFGIPPEPSTNDRITGRVRAMIEAW